jgi:hypothetical protein
LVDESATRWLNVAINTLGAQAVVEAAREPPSTLLRNLASSIYLGSSLTPPNHLPCLAVQNADFMRAVGACIDGINESFIDSLTPPPAKKAKHA